MKYTAPGTEGCSVLATSNATIDRKTPVELMEIGKQFHLMSYCDNFTPAIYRIQ